MTKIIRTATVPMSLESFCKDLLRELQEEEGYEVIALSSEGEDLSLVAEREGVRTIAVNMERHISLLRDMKSLVRLVQVFRKEKPDMVHSMTPKAGLLCMVAAWLTRVPVRLHTFTGLVWPTAKGLTRQILMTTDRITCACATHIIPEGEGVKSDLLNHNITRKPIRILGYGNVRGIDMEHFDPAKYGRDVDEVKIGGNVSEDKDKTCISKSKTYGESMRFVFIGRIVRDKGINELAEAFKRLLDKYPNVTLTLVGPYEDDLDPVTPATREIIDNTDAIKAVGRQADVRLWLSEADVLVFPSYREGFPNVVIEAGAMGLPSIVTDINGSREIITTMNGSPSSVDGNTDMKLCDNGLIIPSQNAERLYDAMEWVITHPDEMRIMASRCRDMIASRFEQSFVRKCLKDYYREILR